MSESEPRMTSGTTPGPEWVSAAEAAKVAGVTAATIRSWARDGLVASQMSQGPFGPQRVVRLDEIVGRAEAAERRRADRRSNPPIPVPGNRRRAERRAKPSPVEPVEPAEVEPAEVEPAEPTPPPPPPPGSPYPSDPGVYLEPLIKTIPDLVGQLTEVTDRAARAEVKVEFLTQQLGELRARLRKLSAADPGALEEVAEETEIDALAPEPGLTGAAANPAVERSMRDLTQDIWGPPRGDVVRGQGVEVDDAASVDQRESLPEGWRWVAEREKKKGWFRRRRGRHG